MTDPGHQQGAIVGQLLHPGGHMVKGAGHGTYLRCAILAQRRRDNAFTDLERRVLQVDQRSVLDADKQPCAAYRQQHNREGVTEQRREVALMNFGQRHAHPDIG
ncbi:hypothetical protein D3C75_746300 [compost metagenome]